MNPGQLPESQKVAEDLRAFAKLNEGRLYKLLKTCMDPQTDLKSLVKSTVGRFFRSLYAGIHEVDRTNSCDALSKVPQRLS